MIRTVDRDGNVAYVCCTGAVVRDGYGRNAWSMYLSTDQRACTYFTDTKRDALAELSQY